LICRSSALHTLALSISEEDIVVAVYQTCFDWIELYQRDLNYVSVGAMGQASSHGLGLALSNPDRKVYVFDGDGSLLMNLGSLVTIAGSEVTNIFHFVFVNRVYEVNDEQPIPGANKVDFAGLAKSAGFKGSKNFTKIENFKRELPRIISSGGPQFVSLEIETGSNAERNYRYIHSSAARENFRKRLNGPS